MTLRLIWDGKESETADTFYHTAEEAKKEHKCFSFLQYLGYSSLHLL